MQKIFLITALFFLLFLSVPKTAKAIYNPLSVSNNRFGIHIMDENDLKDAANLVNSEGGDWGYVTLVIQKTDRNKGKWQEILNSMRRLHLIPIVRVATRPLGDIWEKPNFGEIDGWVDFFNSLNWVVKNRYIVIGNEPNHAKEWGGEVNPEEYATYLKEFSTKLKNSSEDYFVLPAGLDASAPDPSPRAKTTDTISESSFLQKMLNKDPEIFNYLDGWTSHSYPNPDFSGSEYDTGRGSVRTYDWELNFLKSLGLKKELPVFITETGWIHNANSKNLGKKYDFTFSNAWNDKRIVAVTPFILNYPENPFENFSWKDKNGNFYDFYYDVQKIRKIRGEPIQNYEGRVLALFISPIHIIGHNFSGIMFIENTGQSIWDKSEIKITTLSGNSIDIKNASFDKLEPDNSGFIIFSIKAPERSGFIVDSLQFWVDNHAVGAPINYQFAVINPSKMQIKAIFDKIRGWF